MIDFLIIILAYKFILFYNFILWINPGISLSGKAADHKDSMGASNPLSIMINLPPLWASIQQNNKKGKGLERMRNHYRQNKKISSQL